MSKGLSDQNVTDKICEDCDMPANRGSAKSRPNSQPSNGMCVTCPFCQKLVNAIVSPKQITCPACLTSVAITP